MLSAQCLSVFLLSAAIHGLTVVADDPFPSWNEGPVKQSIADFVVRVAASGGTDFVPPAERLALFDNDGTLWAEQPIYF